MILQTFLLIFVLSMFFIMSRAQTPGSDTQRRVISQVVYQGSDTYCASMDDDDDDSYETNYGTKKWLRLDRRHFILAKFKIFNSEPNHSNHIPDNVGTVSAETKEEYTSINVTSSLLMWRNGFIANNGWIILADTNFQSRFSSFETEHPPLLETTYIIPKPSPVTHECEYEDCLSCQGSLPCHIVGDVYNPVTIIINTPTHISGGFQNSGDVIVLTNNTGILKVSGCLVIQPNSTFTIDVTSVDRGSNQKIEALDATCINGTIDVLSHPCVTTMQKKEGSKLYVLTQPGTCTSDLTMYISIAAVGGALLLLVVGLILVITVPSLRQSIIPWSLRNKEIAATAVRSSI